MPFKQMPPDLTDFNNWFQREFAGMKSFADYEAELTDEVMIHVKRVCRSAWDASAKLHSEYLSGELARIDAERQSE